MRAIGMREKVWGVGVAHLGSAHTRPVHTLSPDLVQRTARTRLRRSRTRGAKSEERRVLQPAEDRGRGGRRGGGQVVDGSACGRLLLVTLESV